MVIDNSTHKLIFVSFFFYIASSHDPITTLQISRAGDLNVTNVKTVFIFISFKIMTTTLECFCYELLVSKDPTTAILPM